MGFRRRAGPSPALLLALILGGTAFAAEPVNPVPVEPPVPPEQRQPPPPKAPPATNPKNPFARPLAPPAPERKEQAPQAQAPSRSTESAPVPLPSPTTPFVPVPPFPSPGLAPVSGDRPFITDLDGKRRQDEQHFNNQLRERRAAFEQRQKEDAEGHAAFLKGKGFWERRRLSNEFKAEQARKRKAFNAEEDALRKKTEWRFK